MRSEIELLSGTSVFGIVITSLRSFPALFRSIFALATTFSHTTRVVLGLVVVTLSPTGAEVSSAGKLS